MKPRATSLPNSDQKIRIHTPQQFCYQHQTNRTEKQPPHQSLIANRNILGIHSVIKDGARANNRIIIRRNKAKFQKNSQTLDRSMRKTMNHLSTRYKADEINQNSSQSLPKSQKQKFICILQSKILKKEAQECPKEIEDPPQKAKTENRLDSVRYHNSFQPITYRISMPNATVNESLEENRNSHHRSVDKKPQIKSHRTEKIETHIYTVRSRSRTIARDQIEIRVSPANKNNEGSRTIQLQPDQEHIKMQKSLAQIEKLEKHSLAKDTKDINIQMAQIAQQKQDPSLNINALRHKQSSNNFESNLDMSSINIRNSEYYENEVNILTKDFFHEWERMNMNKSKIYKVLRKKLVSVFPNFKKHYQEFKESAETNDKSKGNDGFKKQNIEQIMIFTNDLNSNLKTERIGQSLRSISNPAQTKDFQEKMQQFHQRQQLKDIFKQAYFWSRTKNKSMSTNFLNQQQLEKKEMNQLKKIQKNLTFMNYMKSKTNKSEILQYKNKIKGANIIKNKQSILQIEKEGTKQQQFLKKCLDNAIENCIKALQ